MDKDEKELGYLGTARVDASILFLFKDATKQDHPEELLWPRTLSQWVPIQLHDIVGQIKVVDFVINIE